jgi:hypothetical protein
VPLDWFHLGTKIFPYAIRLDRSRRRLMLGADGRFGGNAKVSLGFCLEADTVLLVRITQQLTQTTLA